MKLPQRHRPSWKTRRRVKLWLVWLVFSLTSAALLQGLSSLHLAWLNRLTPDFVTAQLSSKFGSLGFLQGIPAIAWLVQQGTLYPQAVFGFIFLGGLATVAMRERCHDRFLAAFNDDVLTPVGDRNRPDRDAAAAFVELEWTPGKAGPRYVAWSGLIQWCKPFGAPAWDRQRDASLSLAVVTGRSGSGKSRMAYQLARRLARRDLLGGPSPLAVLGWRVGVYWRHVAPGGRRRPDDPWDAGLLIPPGRHDFEYLAGALAGWRPRRPTVLILDDPLPGRAGIIWKSLTAANRTRAFRYPVCLLVTNQTVPPDTGLEFAPVSAGWARDGKPADPQPFTLPAESWFTPDETLRVAFGTGVLSLKSVAVQKAVRENLPRITQGNPLLVELAVEWLRGDKRIEDMTEAGLVETRATRILAALRHRGLEHDSQLSALALSTLVGGAAAERIAGEVKTMFQMPMPLPPLAVLQACFPSDLLTAGAALRIPPTRPDIVGDAFIDQVLAHIGADRAKDLAEAGFRLDPAFMLRNLRRVRPPGSAMTKALLAIDPAAITTVDIVALALGFADVAAICQPADRPLSTAESRDGALGAALEVIARLDAAQRRRFCEGFVPLCTIPRGSAAQRQLRPQVVMHLMTAAAEGAEVTAAETWIALFDLLVDRASGELGSVDGMVLTAASIGEDSLADRFADAAWRMGAVWRPGLAPVFRRMEDVAAASGAATRSSRFAAMAANSEPQIAREAADHAALAARLFAKDRMVQREAAAARRYECNAWSVVPAGVKAAEACHAAEMVVAIAAQFLDDPVIQQQAATVRRWEAYAWCQVTAGAKAAETRVAADLVAAIAARFADDPSMQREAAEARCREAYAWSEVPIGEKAAEARVAAETVDAIAARFVNDPLIQREAIRARRSEAYAWCKVPAGAKAAEAHAAATVAAAIAARFPDDPLSQCEAAVARRCEEFAWSQVPAGAKTAEARAAAEIVAAIAARFPDDPVIQEQVAMAGSCEAHAWSQVPAGAKAAESRVAANFVAAITARFPDDPSLNYEAAVARRCESYAWSKVPAGAGAAEARAAAAFVAAIAARSPHDRRIQKQSAEASRYEAYAWSQVSAGARVAEAREAAACVAALAALFPDDLPIQVDAAQARRCVSNALCQVPAGLMAAEVRAEADIVAAIAACFADDQPVQREAAEARRCEAYAWSQVPAGAKAAEARDAADTVAATAKRFPNDPSIQREAADARRCEAYAWSQVPAGAKAAEARAAADIVAAIAARFPLDTSIQREALMVRKMCLPRVE